MWAFTTILCVLCGVGVCRAEVLSKQVEMLHSVIVCEYSHFHLFDFLSKVHVYIFWSYWYKGEGQTRGLNGLNGSHFM